MTEFIRYNEKNGSEIWEVDTGFQILVYFYFRNDMCWYKGSSLGIVKNHEVLRQLDRDRNSWIENNIEFARIN